MNGARTIGIRAGAAAAVLVLIGAACGSTGEEEAGPAAYRIYGDGTARIQEVALDAVTTVQEIADGVPYHVWTFGGTAPGPVIRVRQGDTVRFTLTNKDTLGLSHSIDFHAAQTPWNVNYVPVAPGESLTFDWVARFPGVFMYHCGVPPVLHHIANGMYGAIIVEPAEPLPPAREFVIVSSEFYAGAVVDGAHEGDVAAMLAAKPTHVVFNGAANRYLDDPLVAAPNEPIRLWVVNAGPTIDNAFHVIGALFDHVYASGNPTSPLNGLQTWNVPPGDGAMFELAIPDEGVYPFVTHAFAYTGLGALGTITIDADAPDAPTSYPRMASPFDGGLTEVSGTVDGGAPIPPARSSGPGSSSPSPAGGENTIAATDAFRFEPATLTVDAGATVTLVNEGAIAHDLTIDALDVAVTVAAGESKTFTIDEPGRYTFYCSIPGHREAGMEGTITVGGT